jgi:uncharacterized protein
MSWALVTGASAGIGAEFARQLAAQKHNLVLVARSTHRLESLAQELGHNHGVEVDIITADLSDRAGIALIEERLRTTPIDVLINNAGFGTTQRFSGGDLQPEQEMLDVLVTSVLRLTHAALPGMEDRGRGGVIIVSSVAGWMPGGTYSAAKAWATTFAESVAGEVKRSGVTVMALCPGYTVTEFHSRANIDESAVPKFMWLDVESLVKAALRDFRKGRAVSTPSLRYKFLGLIMRSVPRWVMRRANVGLSGRTR